MARQAKFTGFDETIRVKGFDLTARIEADEDMGPPWEEHDGHGIVSEWTTRDKMPGERILCSDRYSRRYYDVQASTEKARKDGWDAPPYGGTAGQKAARAVERDFEHLRQWCTDQWHWVGVVLSVSRNGVELSEHAASLWGMESTEDEYLLQVANDLIFEAIETGKAERRRMAVALA